MTQGRAGSARLPVQTAHASGRENPRILWENAPAAKRCACSTRRQHPVGSIYRRVNSLQFRLLRGERRGVSRAAFLGDVCFVIPASFVQTAIALSFCSRSHPPSPDEIKRKRRVFLQLFKCYKNTPWCGRGNSNLWPLESENCDGQVNTMIQRRKLCSVHNFRPCLWWL